MLRAEVLVKIVLALLALFLTARGAVGQPSASPDAERAAIIATVQKFFDTMATKDVAGARTVLLPEGRLFRRRVPSGEIGSIGNSDYLDRLPTQKQAQRERFWNPEIKIQDGIATMWTPYDFWIDGTFSHCGIDVFDFVKTADGWKISGGVYTVQRDGCPPSPLGPLKQD